MKAEDIAASLSEAQRRVIVRAAETVDGGFALPLYIDGRKVTLPTIRRIQDAGLCHFGWPPRLSLPHLTPLGEEVRSHLMKERGEP